MLVSKSIGSSAVLHNKLFGTVGVTMAFNVLLNNALAILFQRHYPNADPNSTEGAKLWATYLMNWTFWSHVRTFAALAAA
jgi:uncharacterized membrane protein